MIVRMQCVCFTVSKSFMAEAALHFNFRISYYSVRVRWFALYDKVAKAYG
jgi:hypothetical protein